MEHLGVGSDEEAVKDVKLGGVLHLGDGQAEVGVADRLGRIGPLKVGEHIEGEDCDDDADLDVVHEDVLLDPKILDHVEEQYHQNR